MKTKILLLCFLGIITISFKAFSQDPNFHIYLCFGQSNMEGMGTIEAQDKVTNPRLVLQADQTCSNLGRTYGNWYTGVPPFNRCWGKLGPQMSFGIAMVNGMPNVKVGIVSAAVSGCDIALFQKSAPIGRAGADIPTQFNGGYAWLLDLAKKAQSVGVIKGILFHQGETNTGDPNWKYKVQEIVNNLRTDLGIGNAPFLAGELLQAPGACCASHNVEINKLPGIITNCYVISSSGLSGNGTDNAHFSSASYRTLGQRYAQKMLTLVNNNNGCTPTAITPYTQVNGGTWAQTATASVASGTKIVFGPQPSTGGTWSWSGLGTSGTAREQTINPTASGTATATFTNSCGAKTTQNFTVTVSGGTSTTNCGTCNWYGTNYPVCCNTTSGWGYENNASCIAKTTCTGASQTCTNCKSASINTGANSTVEFIQDKGIAIFPNPSNGAFNVESTNGNFTLQICDLKGKVLLTRNVENSNISVNSGLASGVYIIKITGQSGTVVSKLIIK
jgi:hypothetical protein